MSGIVVKDIVIPESAILKLFMVLPKGEHVANVTKPLRGVEDPSLERLSGSEVKFTFNPQDARETCDLEILCKKEVQSASPLLNTSFWKEGAFSKYHMMGVILVFSLIVGVFRWQYPEIFRKAEIVTAEYINAVLKEDTVGDSFFNSGFALDWKATHGKKLNEVYALARDVLVRREMIENVTSSEAINACLSEGAWLPTVDDYQRIDFSVSNRVNEALWTNNTMGWSNNILHLPPQIHAEAYPLFEGLGDSEQAVLDQWGAKLGEEGKRSADWMTDDSDEDDDKYRAYLKKLAVRKYKLNKDVGIDDNEFFLDEDETSNALCVMSIQN